MAISSLTDEDRIKPGSPDVSEIFITCSSFEERCLGVSKHLSNEFSFRRGYVFVYDEPSSKRDKHLELLENLLASKGSIEKITVSKANPLSATVLMHRNLKNLKQAGDSTGCCLTVDISTFTKPLLLLCLHTIDMLGLWDNLRIFYTEPKNYVTNLYLPLSLGIQKIAPIYGFVGKSAPTLPLLLIVFLGYEGDRALAIHENLDPEETILIVPKPAYHAEWESKTEEMNHCIIRIVGRRKVEYIHSINPAIVADHLERLTQTFNPDRWRWSIVPLGTKPQALGVYWFWREHPHMFSIVYAQPYRHNKPFFSTGIGKTWLLKGKQP